MNDNVRKVFDLLGVEPNEEFKVIAGDNSDITYKFKFDENLQGYYFSSKWGYADEMLKLLLNGYYKIIKLPKEPKKKKLRDLTNDEYTKWKVKNCVNVNRDCTNCMFRNANCSSTNLGWVNNKEVYSDTFLDQEIEVED